MSVPDRPRLIQLEPAPQREIALDRDVLTIGRQSSCEIVLRDENVSRSHARLVRALSLYWLEDLGSVNGTGYADPGEEAKRLAPREAQLVLDGAHIFIGKHFHFEARGLPATRVEALTRIRDGLQAAQDLSAVVPGLSPDERERYLRVLNGCVERLTGGQGQLRDRQDLDETGRGTLPAGLSPDDLPLPDLPDDLSAPQTDAVRTVLNAFIRDLGSCFDPDEEENKP